ncbi:MAG: alpha/beta hydrolase [Clostridia bacterium]
MTLTAFLFRLMAKRSDRKRDAGLVIPDSVTEIRDLSYGPHGKWSLLDLYMPKEAEKPVPVIVSVHGGGWVYGDKEVYRFYCSDLARRGFAVMNFNYRLAPRSKFPAALEDTNAAFGWLLAQAEEYGLDRERVFAVGDSAGGHMLGLYACICTDPAFAARFAFRPPEGLSLRAVALNCGVYHLAPGESPASTAALMRDVLPGGGTAAELEQISVLEHVTAAFPPAFVMTASGDFLADQAPPLAEKLQSLGVETEYRYYGDEQRVLGHVFHCNQRLPEAVQCNDDECAFFRRFL